MTSAFDLNLFPASHFFIFRNMKSHWELNLANTTDAATIRTSIRAILPLQQHRCASVHCLDERALSSQQNEAFFLDFIAQLGQK